MWFTHHDNFQKLSKVCCKICGLEGFVYYGFHSFLRMFYVS